MITIFRSLATALLITLLPAIAHPARSVAGTGRPGEQHHPSAVFVICLQYPNQIAQSLVLARSIRTFGGAFSEAPVRFYVSPVLRDAVTVGRDAFDTLGVEIRFTTPPTMADRYVLGEKPFAAARAETDAAVEARTGAGPDFLVLLDPNTIMLREPVELILPEGKDFAFSPVHHQNVGSWFEEPPDEWWARIYELLEVPAAALWPMETLADRRILRPYFSAGSLVVRPERGILRAWARDFDILAADPGIARLSADGSYNVFLHQASLAATVTAPLGREEMIQLPCTWNYPLFFDRFYDAVFRFDSLEEVVTMRYEFTFENLPADWPDQVRGPREVIEWIREQFAPGRRTAGIHGPDHCR